MNLQIKEYLIAEFEKLPPSKQEEVIDFIDFLNSKKGNLTENEKPWLPDTINKKRENMNAFERKISGHYYNTDEVNERKEKDNEFFGMWKDREDMADSVEWVNNLRKTQWTR